MHQQPIGGHDAIGRKRKTHCKHGHVFDGTEKWSTNWKGYRCRVCRECNRLRQVRKRENPEFNRHSAERTALWRKRHPDKYREGWMQAQEKKRQILLDARAGGCIKCGEKDPACLDFHHRNGKADKLGHIGVIRRLGIDRLYAELVKCDVLCANCHRKHHRDERNKADVHALALVHNIVNIRKT